MKISKITPELLTELEQVVPSIDTFMEYRPCKVVLKNGEVHDRAYVVEAEQYKKMWGVLPDQDPDKKYILIENVARIQECPFRLPPKFANKMYQSGESGMGYCIYILVLKDGSRLPFLTGNAVDFPNLEPGISMDSVVDLLPHEGRKNFIQNNFNPYTRSAEYCWCIYTI